MHGSEIVKDESSFAYQGQLSRSYCFSLKAGIDPIPEL
jgi:hypothetical protein